MRTCEHGSSAAKGPRSQPVSTSLSLLGLELSFLWLALSTLA